MCDYVLLVWLSASFQHFKLERIEQDRELEVVCFDIKESEEEDESETKSTTR